MNGLKTSATPSFARPRQLQGLSVAALVIGLMAPAAAFASAQISGSQQAVSVDAQNSSIKEVLFALSQKFKLQFNSSGNLGKPISGTYQGSLQHVVARLLEGYRFFIRTNQGALEVTVLGSPNGPTVAGAQPAPVAIAATTAQAQTHISFRQVQKPQDKPQSVPAPQAATGAAPAPIGKKPTSAAPAKPSSPDAAPAPVVLKVAEGPMSVPGPSTAAGLVPKPPTASMPTPTKSGTTPSVAPMATVSANAPTLPMPTSSSPFPGLKPQTNAAGTGGTPTTSAPPTQKQ